MRVNVTTCSLAVEHRSGLLKTGQFRMFWGKFRAADCGNSAHIKPSPLCGGGSRMVT
jgi:hypothetical protein